MLVYYVRAYVSSGPIISLIAPWLSTSARVESVCAYPIYVRSFFAVIAEVAKQNLENTKKMSTEIEEVRERV